MKRQKSPRKCLHCKEEFRPDYRNRGRQRYCTKPACQKERKKASQRAWLEKPGNENYFQGSANAQRVRDWQKAHPGYWRKTARSRPRTLQDACRDQPIAQEEVKKAGVSSTLQDLCASQVPLFLGLISMWSGSTLQDDIAEITRRLIAKGCDILGMVPGMDFERIDHDQTHPMSGAAPESSTPV